MAKKNKKKNKPKPFDIRKRRTRNTAKVVLELLKPFEELDIINNLVLLAHVHTEFEKNLVKEIEWYLIGAKQNPNTLASDLHQYFSRKTKEIMCQRKVREMYQFYVHTNEELHTMELQNDVLIAYLDVINQMITYLEPLKKRIIGINKDESLILTDEMYPELDILTEEIFNRIMDGEPVDKVKEKYLKKFQSLNYPITDLSQLEVLEQHERMQTCIQQLVAPFITKDNLDFIKTPYMTPFVQNLSEGRTIYETSDLKEELNHRRRLLPKKGITLEVPFTTYEDIHFREVFTMDKIYLLYRINTKGGYLYGYYNTKSQYFYSPFQDLHNKNQEIYHHMIENLILFMYAILSTDISPDVDFTEIQTEVREGQTDIKRKKWNKSDLPKEFTDVAFYIRKLPFGSSASDEAKELAEKYGIKLMPDETFVRPFTKQVRKKASEYADIKLE